MNTILYMEIPGLPAYVKLSENAHAIPLRGDMVRIEAEELPCPYSRKMLETERQAGLYVKRGG